MTIDTIMTTLTERFAVLWSTMQTRTGSSPAV